MPRVGVGMRPSAYWSALGVQACAGAAFSVMFRTNRFPKGFTRSQVTCRVTYEESDQKLSLKLCSVLAQEQNHGHPSADPTISWSEYGTGR